MTRNLSEWIMIEHCATRIIEGGDVTKVEDRIAFIEKTPRIRMLNDQFALESKNPYAGTESVSHDAWVYGPKGSSEYGEDQDSRDWCDEMLKLMGWNLTEAKVRHYEVVKTESPYPYTVFSKSYISTLGFDDLFLLNEDLEGYTGPVLFDCLTSLGTSSNRFLVADFNETGFNLNTFRELEPEERTDEIRKISGDFYRSRPEYIEASILSSVQQKMLLKGINLK